MALEKIISRRLVNAMFQNSHHHIKFAFVGNHIERYRNIRQLVSYFYLFNSLKKNQKEDRKKPQFDLVMAVDDLKSFHSLNLEENKQHYTMFVRFTHGKVLNLI
jgi:hypothetical protein